MHAVVAKLGANELDDLMQIFANLKEALCFLGGWQLGRLKSQSNHPWIVFGNPIYIYSDTSAKPKKIIQTR